MTDRSHANVVPSIIAWCEMPEIEMPAGWWPLRQRWGLRPAVTTEPNAIIAPIHAIAMPAILTTREEVDVLEAETADALALQKPLPDDALSIVARGEKEDARLRADQGERRNVMRSQSMSDTFSAATSDTRRPAP